MSDWSMGIGEWISLVFVVIAVVWPSARICRRAGFSPALGVLPLVPGLNLAFLYFMAFAKWPALAELAASSTQEPE